MRHVISLGAGVQSSTMAEMASLGLLTPMPDAAVFADTKREPQEVYDWLDWLTPRLKFPVHIVSKGDLGEEEVRIRVSGRSGMRYRRPQIPAYLDGGAPVFRHCTQEYKIRPLRQAYRRLFGQEPVTQWIGISLDEAERMKMSGVSWLTNRYPLIYDRPMTRHQCIEFWKSYERQPPRSACYFCPYHSNAEWQRLKTKQPHEFAKAVEFERQVQAVCDEVGQAHVYLHRSLTRLDAVQFKDERQEELWTEECEGMCGV